MKYIHYIIFNPKSSEHLKPHISQTDLTVHLNDSSNLLDTNRLEEALASFLELREKTGPLKDVKILAYLTYHLGICYKKLSLFRDNEANLINALTTFEAALQIIHAKHDLQEYAVAYNDLGFIYQAISEYGQKKDYLAKAQAILENAHTFLEHWRKSIDPKENPVDYAKVMYHLANNYNALAQFEAKEANLALAIAAYEAAVQAIPKQEFPSLFGLAQYSKGFAYHSLAEFKDPEENRNKAMSAYKEALAILNSDSYPLEYSHVQNCLANLYIDLARVYNREEYLNSAIMASKEVLDILTTVANYPIGFALILHNLGSACKLYSAFRNNEAYLKKAIHYFEEILKINNLPAASEIIPSTYLNIGLICSQRIEAGIANLAKAIECFKAALELYPAADYPLKRAITLMNLGNAYAVLAGRESPPEREKSISGAVAIYQEALTIFTENDYPLDYAELQYQIGEAYSLMSAVTDKNLYVSMAVTAYEDALRVFTAAEYPEKHQRIEARLETIQSLH